MELTTLANQSTDIAVLLERQARCAKDRKRNRKSCQMCGKPLNIFHDCHC